MLLYLLFSRTEVKREGWRGQSRAERIEAVRADVARGLEAKRLGYMVAEATARRIRELERGTAKHVLEEHAELSEYLKAHDVRGYWGGTLTERLDKIRLAQTRELTEAARILTHNASRAARLLRRVAVQGATS